mgnify:FL=1
MTLAEIMAGLGASQAVGSARTGASLTQAVEGEARDLRDAQRRLQEQEEEAARKDRRRKKRLGVGRMLGMGLGALLALPTGGLSLAAGAALGSGAGQLAAGASQRGGYKLDKVSSGLGEGMFFRGGREDISSAERDTNRYINDANSSFVTNALVNVASDYLTFSSLGKLGGAEKYGAIAAGEGGRGEALKQLLKDNVFDFGKKGMKALPSGLDFNQFVQGQKNNSLLQGSQALDRFIDPNDFNFRDTSNFMDMFSNRGLG